MKRIHVDAVRCALCAFPIFRVKAKGRWVFVNGDGSPHVCAQVGRYVQTA
jgi:hypothetical protein